MTRNLTIALKKFSISLKILRMGKLRYQTPPTLGSHLPPDVQPYGSMLARIGEDLTRIQRILPGQDRHPGRFRSVTNNKAAATAMVFELLGNRGHIQPSTVQALHDMGMYSREFNEHPKQASQIDSWMQAIVMALRDLGIMGEQEQQPIAA